ncbi:MAG: flotillin family protein [Sandaracinaceae bacterium]|nr:flotillin family protein [Sandaracinaceae bacterium]
MAFLALVLIVVLAFVSLVLVVKNVLYVSDPNEVLIFSGRTRMAGDREVGYRISKGGRTLRVPLLEVVDRMDLTNMTIELAVTGAYTRGGIPLVIQGVANIKVPGEEPLIHNCLERFLGYSRQQIMEVAKQTLEGNLRGVLATLTPEQINQDKEAFATKLTEEAEHDLDKLGLVLDTLKIQNVSDEVGYLSAIGRMRSAHVRQNAVIAEANAQAEAAENKWRNTMSAEVSKVDAQIQVARKENERRISDAIGRREAMIAEQRGQVQALIAQTKAEVQWQVARIEQVRLQLQAEVVQPAEAQRRQAEEAAKGAASRIIEQGRASAQVLQNLAAQYTAGGNAGRDVLLMQKLIPLMRKISEPLGTLKVDRLTIIGGGQGTDGDPLATRLARASEQIRAATGIDVPKLIQDKLA